MIRRSFVCSLSLLVWLLLVAAPQPAAVSLQAQSAGVTITGTVVDGSLSPLVGAVITLNRQGAVVARTTSDAAGRFRFERVAPGDYEVKATHAKAPELIRPIRIGAGSKIVNLPLVMASPMKQAEAATDAVSAGGRSATMPVAAPPPPATVSGAAPVVQGIASGGAAGRGGGASDQFRQLDRIASVAESVYYPYQESRDRYDGVEPNRFKNTLEHPLSTFGADVDTASYTNVRRFLSNGQLPPPDAVRIEEFVNYFRFDYAQPRGRAADRR